MPASFPCQDRLLASRDQKAASFVLLPSFSATKSSCLCYLRQCRFICSVLSPRNHQHPSPDTHLEDVNFRFQYPFLCLWFSSIKYHRNDRCLHVFVLKLTCLSFHVFSRPCITILTSVILLRIFFSHLSSHSTKTPKKEKSSALSQLYLLSVHLKTPPILCCHDVGFSILKYIPAFSLSVLSFLMMTFSCPLSQPLLLYRRHISSYTPFFPLSLLPQVTHLVQPSSLSYLRRPT